MVLVQQDFSLNQYQAYKSNSADSSSVTLSTTTAFSLTLSSTLTSTNSPTYPYYISSQSVFYINLKSISNIGRISFSLVNLDLSGRSGTIIVSTLNNVVVNSISGLTSSFATISPFSPSNTDIVVAISNWFRNPKSSSSSRMLASSYGISVSTFSTTEGLMGSLLLVPTVQCTYPCRECNSNGLCTSCYQGGSNGYKLYGNTCVQNCSSVTSSTYYDFVDVCLPCLSKCLSCTNVDNNLRCLQCTTGLLILGGGCVTYCPSGYLLSSDSLSCLPIDNTNFSYAISSGRVIPFPFFISSILLIFIALAGLIRDSYSYMTTNILLQISGLLTIAFLVQFIHSLITVNGIYSVVSSIIGFCVMVGLNVIFTIIFCKNLTNDPRYIMWEKQRNIASKVIPIISSIFSFHIYRIFYSRYLGTTHFSCAFKEYQKYWDMINIFTIISIFAVYGVIIVGDIIGLIFIPYVYQLNITIIETCTLSVLVIALSIIEFRHAKLSTEDLVGPGVYGMYAPYNELSSKSIFLEKYKEVTPYRHDDENLKKRRSLPNLTKTEKEEGDIKSSSFPATPRTQNRVGNKLKQSLVLDPPNVKIGAYVDNIGFTTSPKADKVKFTQKSSYITQTYPLRPIENFKAMINKEDHLKGNLTGSKSNILIPRLSPKEGTTSQKGFGSMIQEPKEITPTYNTNFENEAPGMDNSQYPIEQQEDIIGSFDRDLEDNSILIYQDARGRLVDKRGRLVNRHGYLIDTAGNIVNRAGEIVYRANEIEYDDKSNKLTRPRRAKKTFSNINRASPKRDKVFDAKEPDKLNELAEVEIVQVNQAVSSLNKSNPTLEISVLGNENKLGDNGAINSNDIQEGSQSRRSEQVDPMMDDKPSNYDVFNQRALSVLPNTIQNSDNFKNNTNSVRFQMQSFANDRNNEELKIQKNSIDHKDISIDNPTSVNPSNNQINE